MSARVLPAKQQQQQKVRGSAPRAAATALPLQAGQWRPLRCSEMAWSSRTAHAHGAKRRAASQRAKIDERSCAEAGGASVTRQSRRSRSPAACGAHSARTHTTRRAARGARETPPDSSARSRAHPPPSSRSHRISHLDEVVWALLAEVDCRPGERYAGCRANQREQHSCREWRLETRHLRWCCRLQALLVQFNAYGEATACTGLAGLQQGK